jgi:hypothetical protein
MFSEYITRRNVSMDLGRRPSGQGDRDKGKRPLEKDPGENLRKLRKRNGLDGSSSTASNTQPMAPSDSKPKSAFQPYVRQSDLKYQIPPQQTPEQPAPRPIPRNVSDISNPILAQERDTQDDPSTRLISSDNLGTSNAHSIQQRNPRLELLKRITHGMTKEDLRPQIQQITTNEAQNGHERIELAYHDFIGLELQHQHQHELIQPEQAPEPPQTDHLVIDEAPSSSMNPTQQKNPDLEQQNQQPDHVTDEQISQFSALLERIHEYNKICRQKRIDRR